MCSVTLWDALELSEAPQRSGTPFVCSGALSECSRTLWRAPGRSLYPEMMSGNVAGLISSWLATISLQIVSIYDDPVPDRFHSLRVRSRLFPCTTISLQIACIC